MIQQKYVQKAFNQLKSRLEDIANKKKDSLNPCRNMKRQISKQKW